MEPIRCLKKTAVLGLLLLAVLPTAALPDGGKERNVLFIENPASEKQLVNFKTVSFNEKNYYSPKGPRKSITVVMVFDPGGEPSFAAWAGRQSRKKRASKVEGTFETMSGNQPLSRIRLRGLRLSKVRPHRPEPGLTEVTFTASSLTRELLKAKPPEDPD